MRVLLIEDNRRLSAALKAQLEKDGYTVDALLDGAEGLAYAVEIPYDLIILDIMLPKRDGLTICRELREEHINTPVLMLTARDTVSDRILGLDSGADDYLVKPFDLNELRARLRALLRRSAEQKTSVLTVGDLKVDPATHFVERGGRSIELTGKEFALLEFFVRHPNRVITREMIESHVWGADFRGASNIIESYIHRLRRKIDDPFETRLLETIREVGYRLRRPGPVAEGELQQE
jgi:two-component system, OmpR family, copper resistance phosphate regulon response regulator CusR